MKVIFDHFKNSFPGKMRIQNFPVFPAHDLQFFYGIIVDSEPLGINLVEKPFFRIGLSLRSNEKPIKKRCNHKGSEHYYGGNNTGLNSRVEITHGVLPPSAGLVCGNSIIPREGAFYKSAGTGGAA